MRSDGLTHGGAVRAQTTPTSSSTAHLRRPVYDACAQRTQHDQGADRTVACASSVSATKEPLRDHIHLRAHTALYKSKLSNTVTYMTWLLTGAWSSPSAVTRRHAMTQGVDTCLMTGQLDIRATSSKVLHGQLPLHRVMQRTSAEPFRHGLL